MSRKQTLDILGGLMSGDTATLEQVNHKEIKQENNTEVKPVSNKAIKQTDNRAVSPYNNKKEVAETTEEPKEKATFNLSVRILENLEDSWIQLKRQFKGEQRITKTQIVEKALEIALKDLKTKGERSEFFKQL